MTSKEAYEKYKGREVKDDEYTGVICGYCLDGTGNDSVIVAVSPSTSEYGWHNISCVSDSIFSHLNNPIGYFYVGINVLEKVLVPINPAMRYFICFFRGVSANGSIYRGSKSYASEKYPNHDILVSVIEEILLKQYPASVVTISITGINEVSEEDYNEWAR